MKNKLDHSIVLAVDESVKRPEFGFLIICKRDRGVGETSGLVISRQIKDLPKEIKADPEIPEPFILVHFDGEEKPTVVTLEDGANGRFWTIDPFIDWIDADLSNTSVTLFTPSKPNRNRVVLIPVEED